MKIAFGSCCRLEVRPSEQPVWKQIIESKPDLFIFLGDNIYSQEEHWLGKKHLENRYTEQFSEGRFEYLDQLRDEIPYIATWDDHDLGPNNSKGKENARDFRKVSRSVFLKYLRPSLKSQHGRLERCPKIIYCTYEIDGLLIIVLDVRFYRKNPVKGTGEELLGKTQVTWLWRQLALAKNGQYRATIVCSGSTSVWGEEGEYLKSYGAFYKGFKKEFSCCPTPILLAGDIHRNKYSSHDGHYVELISSGLAQERPRNGGHDKELDNWGELEFSENGYKFKLHGNERTDRGMVIEGGGYYTPAQ